MKTEFEYASDKNALPLHRYQPHKLKYQIVIDVVEGQELGEKESVEMYYVWKVTRKNDKLNLIKGIDAFSDNDLDTDYDHTARDCIASALGGYAWKEDKEREKLKKEAESSPSSYHLAAYDVPSMTINVGEKE